MSAEIVDDLSNIEYHNDRASLSSSGARLLLPPGCPAKFRERMDSAPKPSRVFDFGTLAHSLVLGKGTEFTVLDPEIHGLAKDGSVAASPRSTATWKAAEAEARESGRLPVHVDDYAKATAMAARVPVHPIAGPLFQEAGRAEVSIYADDPVTGVRLRARPDWHFNNNRLVIVDYKTTATAQPDDFSRRAADYGYHMQGAWYIDVAALAGLGDDAAFLLVAQEKEPPYLVTVLEFDAEAIEEGRRRNRKAIDLYARCMETDEWPAYPGTDEIVSISLPHWAISGQQPTIADFVSETE